MIDKDIPNQIYLRKEELRKRMNGTLLRLHIGTGVSKEEEMVNYIREEKIAQEIQNQCNVVNLMNYLDEHRPDGKMCLSNMECEHLEKSWNNKDWETVIKYIRKYLAI